MPDPANVTATFESHPFHGARIVVTDDDSDGPFILLRVGAEMPVLITERQLDALAAAVAQHRSSPREAS